MRGLAIIGVLLICGCAAPTVPTQSDSLCVATKPLAFSAAAIAAMDRDDLTQVAAHNRTWHAHCDGTRQRMVG